MESLTCKDGTRVFIIGPEEDVTDPYPRDLWKAVTDHMMNRCWCECAQCRKCKR